MTLINSSTLQSLTGPVIPVMDPSSGTAITDITLASQEDILKILAEAKCFQATLPHKFKAVNRARILSMTAKQILQDQEELAYLIANEGGKPLKDARVEAARAHQTLMLCAKEAESLANDGIAQNAFNIPDKRSLLLREPIGVVIAISAFNHPLNLIAHQAATAFAAGCVSIIKPDLRTPLSAFALRDRLIQNGMPPEAMIILPCSNEDAEFLASSADIAFLNFIGSATVGWHLHNKIAPGTRIALEHGGNAPAIICADAKLDDAVTKLVRGAFYHAGQVCISTQRIYAHTSIFEPFLEKFTHATEKLIIGDAKKSDTDVGPIISKAAADKIETEIHSAVHLGAKLVSGGKRLGDHFLTPTILTHVDESHTIMRNEIFGPVVCINPFEDINNAIALANNTSTPFQASIFSQNIKLAEQLAQKMDATTVLINDHTAFRVDQMPFGGRRLAGLGLGGVADSIAAYTQLKHIIVSAE